MFRTAPRILLRQAARPSIAAQRRCISTAPAPTRRSWKSLAARLGLAGGIVYYYNTTDVFGDDGGRVAPVHTLAATKETDPESLPTIESIAAERRQRQIVQQHLEAQKEKEAALEAARQGQGEQMQLAGGEGAEGGPSDGQGISGLEAEADQQGAFNPETGEINWDCPCLGGMAHGPCGDEFKAAFSCFVFSKEEPKGMDCIEKFKDMQGCFRQYPEIYGSEIDNDDDDDDMTADAAADLSTPSSSSSSSSSSNPSEPALSGETNDPAPTQPKTPTPAGPHSAEKLEANRRELGLVPENYKPATKEPTNESEAAVPKAAHDAR